MFCLPFTHPSPTKQVGNLRTLLNMSATRNSLFKAKNGSVQFLSKDYTLHHYHNHDVKFLEAPVLVLDSACFCCSIRRVKISYEFLGTNASEKATFSFILSLWRHKLCVCRIFGRLQN